jgi:hypothetical protein
MICSLEERYHTGISDGRVPPSSGCTKTIVLAHYATHYTCSRNQKTYSHGRQNFNSMSCGFFLLPAIAPKPTSEKA